MAELIARLLYSERSEIPPPRGASPPPGLRLDPLLGTRPRPGWSGRWHWHQREFKVVIDELGFRTIGHSWSVPGGARIVFLGDSCTFGWGLDPENTFVAGVEEIVRRRGRPVQLFNAAYAGDSAVVGSYVLREQVLSLKPDVVVLGYSGNNAFRFATVSDAERFRFFALHGRW